MITSPIWLPATLIAGAVQAWRTAIQRRVSHSLSINAAGLVRYLYGIPFTLLLLCGYALLFPAPLPAIKTDFLLFCIGGGLAQIVATNLLIAAFKHRNFVVGTAYSKTEAVQGAALSFLLLGERLHPLAWAGIGCGVIGVMLLSTGGKRMGPGDFLRALGQPAAKAGIASGFFFALTAIGIRRATQAVGGDDHILAALLVLVATVLVQTLMPGGLADGARAGRDAAGVCKLAGVGTGRIAVRAGQRLLVHGLCHRAGGAGADRGPGRGRLHHGVRPFLPERTNAAERGGRAAAGRRGRGAGIDGRALNGTSHR